MKQEKTEVKTYMVKTYMVKAICDCGGEFKPTGVGYMTYPKQIEHKCNVCERKLVSTKTYPHISHEEIKL